MDTPEIRVDKDQLRILSNPTRLELISSLRTDGPATAKQLASRLNRDEMSLYYHLRLLNSKGLLITATRPTATKPETVYATCRLVVDLNLDDAENLDEVKRNVDAILRAASKEYRAAADALRGKLDGSALVGRSAVRISAEKREELRTRLMELSRWMNDGNGEEGERLSLTFVLTPLVRLDD